MKKYHLPLSSAFVSPALSIAGTSSALRSFARAMILLTAVLMTACVNNDYDEGDVAPVEQNLFFKTSSGAEPVDLGLSVCWASWNVGAKAPEQYGNYYAWGDINPHRHYDQEGYTEEFYKGPKTIPAEGICGSETYDVAVVKWKDGNWRMPTQKEALELVNRCIWSEDQLNGVNGWTVKGPNGNTIFLPKGGRCIDRRFEQVGEVGHYWQGTVCGNRDMIDARVFDVNNYLWGLNVRAVMDKAE